MVSEHVYSTLGHISSDYMILGCLYWMHYQLPRHKTNTRPMMSDFLESVRNGDLPLTTRFLQEGIDANSRSELDGTTALYWAACVGHVHITRLLLAHGADANAVGSQWGTRPVHAAADRGHTQCVFILLGSGADINIRCGNNEDTPLHKAAFGGHRAVCGLLLENGADPTLGNVQGRTPRQEAQFQQHYEVYQLIHAYEEAWRRDKKTKKLHKRRETVTDGLVEDLGKHVVYPKATVTDHIPRRRIIKAERNIVSDSASHVGIVSNSTPQLHQFRPHDNVNGTMTSSYPQCTLTSSSSYVDHATIGPQLRESSDILQLSGLMKNTTPDHATNGTTHAQPHACVDLVANGVSMPASQSYQKLHTDGDSASQKIFHPPIITNASHNVNGDGDTISAGDSSKGHLDEPDMEQKKLDVVVQKLRRLEKGRLDEPDMEQKKLDVVVQKLRRLELYTERLQLLLTKYRDKLAEVEKENKQLLSLTTTSLTTTSLATTLGKLEQQLKNTKHEVGIQCERDHVSMLEVHRLREQIRTTEQRYNEMKLEYTVMMSYMQVSLDGLYSSSGHDIETGEYDADQESMAADDGAALYATRGVTDGDEKPAPKQTSYQRQNLCDIPSTPENTQTDDVVGQSPVESQTDGVVVQSPVESQSVQPISNVAPELTTAPPNHQSMKHTRIPTEAVGYPPSNIYRPPISTQSVRHGPADSSEIVKQQSIFNGVVECSHITTKTIKYHTSTRLVERSSTTAEHINVECINPDVMKMQHLTAQSAGHQSTAQPAGHQSTAQPAGHQSTAQPAGHQSTAQPAGHQSTAQPAGHQSTAQPAGHQSTAQPAGHQSTAQPAGHQSTDEKVVHIGPQDSNVQSAAKQVVEQTYDLLHKAISPVFRLADQSFLDLLSSSLVTQVISMADWTTDSLLDDHGREWLEGVDYTLHGKTENINITDNISCRSIWHNEKRYHLQRHQTSDSDLEYNLTQLSDLPLTRNISVPLHTYISSHGTDSCGGMDSCTPTRYIVHTPPATTLRKWLDKMAAKKCDVPVIPERLVTQQLYGLLSGLRTLHKYNIRHVSMNSRNIYLDKDLAPVLQSVHLPCVMADHSDMYYKSHPIGHLEDQFYHESYISCGIDQQVSTDEVSRCSDIYMAGCVIVQMLAVSHHITLTPDHFPRYDNGCLVCPAWFDHIPPGLRNIIIDMLRLDQRLSVLELQIRAGLLLFGPSNVCMTSMRECQVWHQTELMKILMNRPTSHTIIHCCGDYVRTVKSSITYHDCVLRQEFLTSFATAELWRVYSVNPGSTTT